MQSFVRCIVWIVDKLSSRGGGNRGSVGGENGDRVCASSVWRWVV